MFTGIIQATGSIKALDVNSSGTRVTIHAPSIAPALSISKSIAVNGCCLTVVGRDKEQFSCDLSGETLQKTSFGSTTGGLQRGALVNLEQPLTAGQELGGHLVLGHVDTTGRVSHLIREVPDSGSWWFGVEVQEDFARQIVPKGSITIDGVSLTVARWNGRKRIAEIAVIPYTYEHTNIRNLKPGDAVNLEGDILGKYIDRYLETRSAAPPNLTLARLLQEGF